MSNSWQRFAAAISAAVLLAIPATAAPPATGWHGFDAAMTNYSGWADWAATNKPMDQLWEGAVERVWIGGRKRLPAYDTIGVTTDYQYGVTNAFVTNVVYQVGTNSVTVTFTNIVFSMVSGTTNHVLASDGNTNWYPTLYPILYTNKPDRITLTNGVEITFYLSDPVYGKWTGWEPLQMAEHVFYDDNGVYEEDTVWPNYVVAELAIGGTFDDYFGTLTNGAYPGRFPMHTHASLSWAGSGYDPSLWDFYLRGSNMVSPYATNYLSGDGPLIIGGFRLTNAPPTVLAALHWVADYRMFSIDATDTNTIIETDLSYDRTSETWRGSGTVIAYSAIDDRYEWMIDLDGGGGTIAVASATAYMPDPMDWVMRPEFTNIATETWSIRTNGVWSPARSTAPASIEASTLRLRYVTTNATAWTPPAGTATWTGYDSYGYATGTLSITGGTNITAVSTSVWASVDSMTYSTNGQPGDVVSLELAQPTASWEPYQLDGGMNTTWWETIRALQRITDAMKWTAGGGSIDDFGWAYYETTNGVSYSWGGWGWAEAAANCVTNPYPAYPANHPTWGFSSPIAYGAAHTSPAPGWSLVTLDDCVWVLWSSGREGWPVRLTFDVTFDGDGTYEYEWDTTIGAAGSSNLYACAEEGVDIIGTSETSAVPYVRAYRRDIGIRSAEARGRPSYRAPQFDEIHGPWASGKDLYLRSCYPPGMTETGAAARAVFAWETETSVAPLRMDQTNQLMQYAYSGTGSTTNAGYSEWLTIADEGAVMPFYNDTEYSKGWAAIDPLWLYRYDVTNGMKRVTIGD